MNRDTQTFKVIMIGDSHVGKSSLLLRYAHNTFSTSFISTIGVDFKIKKLEIDGRPTNIQIWDTSGQERFRSITTSYFKGAHAMIVMFDLTNMETFNRVERWISDAKRQGDSNIVMYLVGGKLDLVKERQVAQEKATQLAKRHGMPYIELSSKKPMVDGTDGVNRLFAGLIKLMVERKTKMQNTGFHVKREKTQRSKCCIPLYFQ